ncbi:MAG: shikimate kinase [Methylacidiphilales bacterium]|nr:shikimate kinase [Candidatus Methylacidiphilales bacterium]
MGKSTLVTALANHCQIISYDLDTLIADSTKQTISELIRYRGIRKFRMIESNLLRSISAPPLLSTGAGVIEIKSNRWYLRVQGVCIYMAIPLQKQIARLRYSKGISKRPLISRNLVLSLRLMQLRRRSIYQHCATITFWSRKEPVISSITRLISMLSARGVTI